ncbi:patatin-like phospholipase family protein [Microbulbifer sp. THAF38]|uniref:patatin-like phospholipase family protein n=1 Tax=Microbulbifer sp. THAF38 TaxID=2587856 RepID=UPI001268B481|nr:patatin-like phospholipase family protein [Microbulbifer sp. THAF38]QFT55179.1 Patatin-like phospholipase [Microbulbifer sp. THAF38]
MFDQVVFAGGGGRCTWQIGFWEAIADQIKLEPRVLTGVSAGAMIAGLILIGRATTSVDYFSSVFSANRRNVYWRNLLGKEPVFPQYEIYKKGIRELFSDRFKNLKSSAELRVAVSRPPTWLPASLGLAVGGAIYYSNKYLLHKLHSKTARRLGYKQDFFRAQDCADVGEFERLILSSSCTPPFTPRLSLDGRQALDGGVVDNVPVEGIDPGEGRVLILLTRRYRGFPDWFTQPMGKQLWTYVQPSEPPPISVWDFTNPEGIVRTYEIGRRDGRLFLQNMLAERGFYTGMQEK